MNRKKKFLICLLVLFLTFFNVSLAQSTQKEWVDSVFTTLSSKEKIAQLFMVAAYSNRDQKHQQEIEKLIKEEKIGGLIFFQGTPSKQAELTNLYQAQAKVPLLLSMDAEWGLAMRLDSTTQFPYQMALGAIQNNELIYEMGGEIARQCKRLGVHVNLAPVVDVNNNANNPVINYRSFGENKEKVAKKGLAYVKGMQEQNVLACAKHFPGHGDTGTDSHLDLPIIRHDKERLKDIELYPFEELIAHNVGGIMIAHLSIPALDSTINQPSTLSKPIVTNLLKKELGFEGLIFTDALNMKGVTKYYEKGEVDMKALLAGNDVLLFSEDVPKAIAEIQKAVAQNKISQEEIDQHCRKVLATKYWVGLNNYKAIELENLTKELNNPYADLINRQLSKASLTVLRNQKAHIPIRDLDKKTIATLSINADTLTAFQQMTDKYSQIKHFYLSPKSNSEQAKKVYDSLQKYDLWLVGIHQTTHRPYKNFKITDTLKTIINTVAKSDKAIINFFGNAYSIAQFEGLNETKTLTVAYQNNKYAQEYTAQLLFGAVGANGKLPVTVNNYFVAEDGLTINPIQRLAYDIPESMGVNSQILQKIDEVVLEGLNANAFPACEVLVVKNNTVIFNKTYGYQTYDKLIKTQKDNLYDLASITKVVGATTALMKLEEDKKINLSDKLSHYVSHFSKKGKTNLTFKEILAHQSGLQAWIPYWKNTLDESGSFKKKTFKNSYSKNYPFEIAPNLFLYKKYQKKLVKEINESELGEKKYRYSGLSFYRYPELIQKITKQDIDSFLKAEFYKPLGAFTLTYRPLDHFPLHRIIPTEYDSLFRKTQIHGTVHDEGAAMMNGVSGNAGLFSSANDLAKLVQMYLNGGTYGGKRFLKEETITKFTACQYCETENRRGLGFDKPLIIYHNKNSSTAKDASKYSYGHSGFTGTMFWADPEEGLIFIFLSNRVYPTRENRKLYQLNIRPRIHQIIYDAVK
jgi:beta-glucosidase-like glycosyl hydrolase/CubicO group peptidase (beta-lactamase class C family)